MMHMGRRRGWSMALAVVVLIFFWSAQCVCFLSLFTLCKEDINAMEMEDDKRDLISREISKFRDTHKVMYQTALVTV